MKKSEQNSILQKITRDWSQRDFEKAFSGVEKLIQQGTPEFRAAAWLLGGMIKEELGDIDDARNDWLSGLECSATGTFSTYTLEYNIASSFEKQGLLGEAISWFRRALMTCAAGSGFSGEQALSDFFRLTSDDLTADDEKMVAAALSKSWRALRLPGKPDTADLKGSVIILGLHFSEIVDKAKNED